MKLTEIISETSKPIIWETFHWAPYNCSIYFKQYKGHCPFFFPQHFPWPGAKATGVISAGVSLFLSPVLCSWVDFFKLVTSLRNLSDLREGVRWKEKPEWEENCRAVLGEASSGWHCLPACSSPKNQALSHLQLIPGGPDLAQAGLAESLHLYSQLVHLFSANFAVTLQTDQCCDLLPAGWWEPPLALPIFKQLKLFCIS